MQNQTFAQFQSNLAGIAEMLSFVVPLLVGLAGLFGIATLVFFTFIRQH
jgi:uncharacterized membrane protein YuzA (DUF378 family)